MNTLTQNHTAALKALDPAPAFELDDTARIRKEARMHQIISDRSQAPAAAPARTRRRLSFIATGGVAAVVAGLVVASAVVPASASYASWTPTASMVTSSDQLLAMTACVHDAGTPEARALLAERRGDWVAIAAATPAPSIVTCLVHLPASAGAAGEVNSAVSGGPGAIPGPGQFTDGAITHFGSTGFLGIGASPDAAFNVGEVGPDVVAVDVTAGDGTVTHATVHDGRFIAWWPGTAFGVETEGNGAPAPNLRYRLTLTDGTILEDATPVLPE